VRVCDVWGVPRVTGDCVLGEAMDEKRGVSGEDSSEPNALLQEAEEVRQ
jgi:hypothetical protein